MRVSKRKKLRFEPIILIWIRWGFSLGRVIADIIGDHL